MLRAAAALLMTLTLAAPASAADGLQSFRTPTGHIACMASKTDLRCDIDGVAHPAKRPKSCELDYGSAFGLTRTDRAKRLCAGDTVLDPKAKVLEYGKTKTYGSFTCTSRERGLRCSTRAGHGFELSRQRQKLF